MAVKRKNTCVKLSLTLTLLALSLAILVTAMLNIHFKSKVSTAEKVMEDFLQFISYGKVSQKQIILAVAGLSAVVILVTFLRCVMNKVPKLIWCAGGILCPFLILCMSASMYYVYKYEYETFGLEEQMVETFDKIRKTSAINGKWRALENDLECCGVYGPRDYFKGATKQNQSKLDNFLTTVKKGAKLITAATTLNVASIYDELKAYRNVPTTCYSKKLVTTVGQNGCLIVVKAKVYQYNKKWLNYFLIILGLSTALLIVAIFSFS